MNKELESKAKELNQWLINQDIVKEYQKYEKIINENKELKNKELKLKAMQKEIVNKKHTDEDCSDYIKEYEELKEEFFNHPLVHNYLLLKQEVNQLIQQINQIINQNINE